MPVALKNAIVTTTVLLYLFSVSATGFAVLTLSMSSSAGKSSPRRSLKKKSVADNMALKIGLNVVPKKKSGYTHNVGNDAQTETNKVRKVKVPTITWTQNAKDFFWRDNEQSREKANLRNTSRTTTGVPARQRGERQVQVQVQAVANKEEFPLYLLRNVLPPKSLARALSIVLDEDTAISDAEEMEQHERVSGGKVRTLRRSIVSRLKCTTESSKSLPTHVQLLNMIVSGLPVELVEGMPLSGSTKDNGNTSIHKCSNSEHVPTTTHNHSHQYEDGSIVYYRTAGNDFYDTHHDSYAPGDPPRQRQRAYTILLYLRAPPGLPLMGGTEFPRLTPLRQGQTSESKKGRTATTTSTRNQPKERLVVKPRPGDALVWPNFDEDGNPHMHSVHRALSIAPSTPPTTISKGKLQADEIARKDKDNDLMGKIVVNLWFEG
ncbi:hypothetical protein FRACYDRAFT_246743 [Fragilariopsis cylindrus CCMP1102]|uniref:Fe2OG dioxygenase domain-containing protein n=1 Tax=Fragilariopsis cylindrus CCMP1102 TaxID=635003 RepID=A0A1E7EXW0_9STRA|nr:hypothetical protein FRACYDRAFT_246743 [Fragilariopsis cylindrus CCMP1102]|eukprot:OEU10868.1 hypothetical protein FRACYDRAFT_246743 [Fragilariopsis cylindrus CCMP1102]